MAQLDSVDLILRPAAERPAGREKPFALLGINAEAGPLDFDTSAEKIPMVIWMFREPEPVTK